MTEAVLDSLSPRFITAASQRLKALPWLKSVSITGFMVIFLLAYFATLKHPLLRVHQMPECALDRWIPYQGWTVGIYFSLWPYVFLPPALIGTPRELLRYGVATVSLAVAGLVVFFLWPTQVALQGTGFLKSVDPGGNACPSFHAAFSVFTALCLGRLLRVLAAPRFLRLLNWLWCAAIIYSTLATKQHVCLDLVAGAALGALAASFVPFR